MARSFKRQLRALAYPFSEEFDPFSVREVRSLACWLEKHVIQLQDKELTLETSCSDEEWKPIFIDYLKKAHCPFDLSNWSEEALVQAVGWFISFALQQLFSDNAQEYLKESEIAFQSSSQEWNDVDFQGEEMKHTIREFAKDLGIPPHDNPAITLNTILNCVTRVQDYQSTGLPPLSFGDMNFALEHMNSGIDTEDPTLSRAATILRMLYVSDLRKLQQEINNIIVQVQNFTANPTADVSKGKVGK